MNATTSNPSPDAGGSTDALIPQGCVPLEPDFFFEICFYISDEFVLSGGYYYALQYALYGLIGSSASHWAYQWHWWSGSEWVALGWNGWFSF